MDEFKNESGLKFIDISNEISRTYRFPGDEYIVIEFPLKLNVQNI